MADPDVFIEYRRYPVYQTRLGYPTVETEGSIKTFAGGMPLMTPEGTYIDDGNSFFSGPGRVVGRVAQNKVNELWYPISNGNQRDPQLIDCWGPAQIEGKCVFEHEPDACVRPRLALSRDGRFSKALNSLRVSRKDIETIWMKKSDDDLCKTAKSLGLWQNRNLRNLARSPLLERFMTPVDDFFAGPNPVGAYRAELAWTRAIAEFRRAIGDESFQKPPVSGGPSQEDLFSGFRAIDSAFFDGTLWPWIQDFYGPESLEDFLLIEKKSHYLAYADNDDGYIFFSDEFFTKLENNAKNRKSSEEGAFPPGHFMRSNRWYLFLIVMAHEICHLLIPTDGLGHDEVWQKAMTDIFGFLHPDSDWPEGREALMTKSNHLPLNKHGLPYVRYREFWEDPLGNRKSRLFGPEHKRRSRVAPYYLPQLKYKIPKRVLSDPPLLSNPWFQAPTKLRNPQVIARWMYHFIENGGKPYLKSDIRNWFSSSLADSPLFEEALRELEKMQGIEKKLIDSDNGRDTLYTLNIQGA